MKKEKNLREIPVHRVFVWRAIAVTKSLDWSSRVIIARDSSPGPHPDGGSGIVITWNSTADTCPGKSPDLQENPCSFHELLGERKIYIL
jgi:hypothetical protein